MCLVVKKGTEKQILTEDLTVYKIVKSYYAEDNTEKVNAIYRSFEYVAGVTYKTNIKSTLDDCSRFDDLAGKFAEDLLKCNEISYSPYEKRIMQKYLDFYSEGFHFALTLERFSSSYFGMYDIICEFIVPAGSEIIYDESGLGVSNQIIYTGKVHGKNK